MKNEKEKKTNNTSKKSNQNQTKSNGSKKKNYSKSQTKTSETKKNASKSKNYSSSASSKYHHNSKTTKTSNHSNNKESKVKKNYSHKTSKQKQTTSSKNSNTPTKKIETKSLKSNTELEKTLIINGAENKNIQEVVDKLEEENIVTKDRVIKRSKGKKTAIIILSIIMALVLISTIIYVYLATKTDESNSQTVNSNVYAKVNKNKNQGTSDTTIISSDYEHIIRISLSEFEQKVLDKENMLILIASETCYACVTFEPIIEELFAELDKTIYEVDISQYSDDDISTFRTYYNFIKTPTIFYIEDGIVKTDVTSKMTKENLEIWLDENVW